MEIAEENRLFLKGRGDGKGEIPPGAGVFSGPGIEIAMQRWGYHNVHTRSGLTRGE